jgi:RNA polymerase sigma factor (sigma-70 family)
MYQITRNLIVDHYTVRKNVSLEVLQEDGFDPVSEDAQPDIVAEASLLRGAIESLDADYRQAVYLSFVEGLRVKDIAEILGVSENLISVLINRVKKKLRERFT